MATNLDSERYMDFAIASADSAERITLASIEAEIHRMQAEAMRTFLKASLRGAKRLAIGTGRLISAMFDGVALARTYEQLSNLDDATLERMGLRREELAGHAFKVVYGFPAETPEPVLEAISGGKVSAAPSIETPERRAA